MTRVWSVRLHGSESWKIKAPEKQKLEALSMWYQLRMLIIKQTDNITNEETVKRVKE